MKVIHIVVGSVTGTALAAAKALRTELERDYTIVFHEYATLDDILVQPNQTLLFCVSNTGEGELSPWMRRIHVQLSERHYDMTGHQYLLINFGDSRYKAFGLAGQTLDTALKFSHAMPLSDILTLDAFKATPADTPLYEWVLSGLKNAK